MNTATNNLVTNSNSDEGKKRVSRSETSEDMADNNVLGDQLYQLFSNGGKAFKDGEDNKASATSMLSNSSTWDFQNDGDDTKMASAIDGLRS